jgi:hypothetical protein
MIVSLVTKNLDILKFNGFFSPGADLMFERIISQIILRRFLPGQKAHA